MAAGALLLRASVAVGMWNNSEMSARLSRNLVEQIPHEKEYLTVRSFVDAVRPSRFSVHRKKL
jgi:hypothetical protein